VTSLIEMKGIGMGEYNEAGFRAEFEEAFKDNMGAAADVAPSAVLIVDVYPALNTRRSRALLQSEEGILVLSRTLIQNISPRLNPFLAQLQDDILSVFTSDLFKQAKSIRVIDLQYRSASSPPRPIDYPFVTAPPPLTQPPTKAPTPAPTPAPTSGPTTSPTFDLAPDKGLVLTPTAEETNKAGSDYVPYLVIAGVVVVVAIAGGIHFRQSVLMYRKLRKDRVKDHPRITAGEDAAAGKELVERPSGLGMFGTIFPTNFGGARPGSGPPTAQHNAWEDELRSMGG